MGQVWDMAICSVIEWFTKNPEYRMESVFAALDDEIVDMGKKTVCLL